MIMVGKLAYYLLSFVDTYFQDKFIPYLSIEFNIFFSQWVYNDVRDLVGIFWQVESVHFLQNALLIFVIHFKLGNEFLDCFYCRSLVGTAHKRILLFFFKILLS